MIQGMTSGILRGIGGVLFLGAVWVAQGAGDDDHNTYREHRYTNQRLYRLAGQEGAGIIHGPEGISLEVVSQSCKDSFEELLWAQMRKINGRWPKEMTWEIWVGYRNQVGGRYSSFLKECVQKMSSTSEPSSSIRKGLLEQSNDLVDNQRSQWEKKVVGVLETILSKESVQSAQRIQSQLASLASLSVPSAPEKEMDMEQSLLRFEREVEKLSQWKDFLNQGAFEWKNGLQRKDAGLIAPRVVKAKSTSDNPSGVLGFILPRFNPNTKSIQVQTVWHASCSQEQQGMAWVAFLLGDVSRHPKELCERVMSQALWYDDKAVEALREGLGFRFAWSAEKPKEDDPNIYFNIRFWELVPRLWLKLGKESLVPEAVEEGTLSPDHVRVTIFLKNMADRAHEFQFEYAPGQTISLQELYADRVRAAASRGASRTASVTSPASPTASSSDAGGSDPAGGVWEKGSSLSELGAQG